MGDWDHAIAVIGAPKYGKSYYAISRARELRRAPCYVIAHDPIRTYEGADIARHRSQAELVAALGQRPGAIHVLDVDDGLDVIYCALHVAQHLRGASGIWEKGTRAGTPVLVLLDEVTSVSGISPSHLEPDVAKVYAQRRHLRIGFIWLAQRPPMVHPTLWDLSTEIRMFRTKPRWHSKLEDAGVSAELLERTRALPKHVHLTYPDDDPDA